jgi:hypothetical protein
MVTFTDDQQKEHREAFIEDCRQKAWSAACHADFVSKSLDDVLAHYEKLKKEDTELAANIAVAEAALDSHTVDNRQKRKTMQERRNELSRQMQFVIKNHEEGQRAMQNLYQSIESNLALAKHAETWEWKEAQSDSEKPTLTE